MYKLCVFAGTTEGRRIVDFLLSNGANVTACVATEYGETMLEQHENLTVSAKRLTSEEMCELFEINGFDAVIDATHPYASIVSENIVEACGRCNTMYLRLKREDASAPTGAVVVSDVKGAVDYLNEVDGNILLTTGSKELASFIAIKNFSERVYARVLPMEESLALCSAAGLKSSHIIAMQGPFSKEMNIAMLRSTGASFLVTKQSGRAGGFDEKIAAASAAGVKTVVIGRPNETALLGRSFRGTVELLSERFGFTWKPSVSIVGIGPGNEENMTIEAKRAIDEAECVIGAKRMIAASSAKKAVFKAIAPGRIAEIIASHKEFSSFAVVMSGDSGFFSGTKKLLPLLAEYSPRVIAGVSSVSYLASKCSVSYEDALTISAHGRDIDIALAARENALVFVLTGGENTPDKLCRDLARAGLGQLRVTVGENLSYETERITSLSAEEISMQKFDSLSAMFIENAAPDRAGANKVCCGILDEAFIRNDGGRVIPMTKSEVRAVCMSKLMLEEDSICYDIGAGTGSVAIEMALCAKNGAVYAIERRDDAIELIKKNCEKFGTDRINIVHGVAPEALKTLPAPSHAFIGGSSGNMREIIALLLEKNPLVHIVATSITLETVAELTSCMNELAFNNSEVVSLSVARSNRIGNYNMMSGQNPIHIFTLYGGTKK